MAYLGRDVYRLLWLLDLIIEALEIPGDQLQPVLRGNHHARAVGPAAEVNPDDVSVSSVSSADSSTLSDAVLSNFGFEQHDARDRGEG